MNRRGLLKLVGAAPLVLSVPALKKELPYTMYYQGTQVGVPRPEVGDLWFNTLDSTLTRFNGKSWELMSA